jgi:hypothetical protein
LVHSSYHALGKLTRPVPSAAMAAMGAKKGKTAAGTTNFFKGDSAFIAYKKQKKN